MVDLRVSLAAAALSADVPRSVDKSLVSPEVFMARFRSNKRAKELQRKAKHEAKEARKKERAEKGAAGVDDDIDWSQAVGVDPPPGWVPPGGAGDEDADGEDVDDEAESVDSAKS
jgi:hypothetical protein